jgi:lipopolysaccharide export system ATP-binding protein
MGGHPYTFGPRHFITDKTYLMFEGGILKEGIPEELVEDEMVRRVYLGQNFELRKKKIEF